MDSMKSRWWPILREILHIGVVLMLVFVIQALRAELEACRAVAREQGRWILENPPAGSKPEPESPEDRPHVR